MRAHLPICIALALTACKETEECRKLTVLHGHYKSAVITFKGRAKMRKHMERSLQELEEKTKQTLVKAGLNLSEKELKAELDKRVAKVKGASIERTTKQLAPAMPGAPPGQGGGAVYETVWRIQFKEKKFNKALEQIEMLMATPPLFKISTIIQEPKSGRWVLELARAAIDEVPMNLPPTPFERPPKASVVKEEFGFCGAKELRAKIAELDKEIDALEEDSTALSTLLPKRATIEGRRRRTDYLVELETEGRRIIQEMLSAVRTSGLKLKAVGVEQEVVLLEVYAGPKDKGKLEKHLAQDILRSVKYLDSPDDNVLKVTVPNRVANERKEHQSHGNGMVPGVRLAPKKSPK